MLAQDEARALGHGYIGTEHLLLGILREEEGLGAQVLGSLGVTVDEVARPGCAHRRPRGRVADRPDPVHAAREARARALASRSPFARPQPHRHRAPSARARPRQPGRRPAGPARVGPRRADGPRRGHPHALRADLCHTRPTSRTSEPSSRPRARADGPATHRCPQAELTADRSRSRQRADAAPRHPRRLDAVRPRLRDRPPRRLADLGLTPLDSPDAAEALPRPGRDRRSP